jgi:coenzyme F420 hydrogenase subunit beta
MSSVFSTTVSRVLKGDLCSGCGLCAGLAPDAIKMETVAPGYSRPRVGAPVNADAERAIATACPGALVAAWQDAPSRHPYWGPYHRVLTGFATDPAIRHAGSSGAALTALAIHALETGMVDGVLHVVADPERPTRNRMAWSIDAASVLAGAGSRYAASSPLAEIDTLLSGGRRFVFIGKPCDVSALRQLATVDQRVDALVPLKLAFFCAGIPSHAGADRIIRAMKLEPATVTAFRYRGNGWPGLTRAETADGQVGEMCYADSWGRQLSKEIQFRCKICPDAVGGVADIAAADAWYGDDGGYPEFDERDGRSLIMTRTTTGEAVLDAAVSRGQLSIEPLVIREIERMQPAQARRKRVVAARLVASAITLQPLPLMAGLDVSVARRRSTWRELWRNGAGTVRRILSHSR